MCKRCVNQDRGQREHLGDGGIDIVCGFKQIRDRFWRQYDMYIVPNSISKQCWWHWWRDTMFQWHKITCMDRFPNRMFQPRHNWVQWVHLWYLQ